MRKISEHQSYGVKYTLTRMDQIRVGQYTQAGMDIAIIIDVFTRSIDPNTVYVLFQRIVDGRRESAIGFFRSDASHLIPITEEARRISSDL